MKESLMEIDPKSLEVDILSTYMPQPLTEEEMDAIIETCIPIGKLTMKDFGQLMKLIQSRVGSRGDMKYISVKLKELLNK